MDLNAAGQKADELIAAGEDTTRTKRGEPYKVASPYMTSDEAAAS